MYHGREANPDQCYKNIAVLRVDADKQFLERTPVPQSVTRIMEIMVAVCDFTELVEFGKLDRPVWADLRAERPTA